ncbi:aldose epimerase family protein [Virgibacillus halophilus]|uniref:aldose epimerase family protein n=1 Tax=Tigheibacillus halophilus TaxID=361280 RepID=UPI003629723A
MDVTIHLMNGKWHEYLLENDHGMQVGVLDFGGIITKMLVPDKRGHLENVVLGYENYHDYEENPNCFGATIGRVAGRIKDARFTIEGQTYSLEQNEGSHHLHSGKHGFQQTVWDAKPFRENDKVGVTLRHTSPDGEGGYPGTVSAQVTYTLDNANKLTIDYHATTDKTTPLALTNHSYFNLSGNLQDTVGRHHVQMPANNFAELDNELIPTGKLLSTEGTPFDFRSGKFFEDGLLNGDSQNQIVGGGYDHFFIFDNHAAHEMLVTEPISGRTMTVTTTQPGVVLYTANGLEDGLPLQSGRSRKHLGFCLETQAHPAALNHTDFPEILLRPEETYQHQTVFQFGIH